MPQSNCARLLAGAGLAVIISGCTALATSPTEADAARLDASWKEGQRALAQLGGQWVAEGGRPLPESAFSLGRDHFRFVGHREPLSVKGEPVAGYFDPPTRTVHYYEPLADGVIPHEAGHAILYLLGDRRWRCVFHSDCR